MKTLIRNAAENDVAAIHRMMRDFAEFENLEEYFRITEERLRSELFSPDSFLQAIVAERDGKLIGYALFFPVFASFSGERRYFLEDLYVTADARGSGAGRLMLREIARRGIAEGYSGLEFHVLDWNERALGFYQKLGAIASPADLNYKFIGRAFAALAE